ncbi:cuticle protein AMP1A-like [Penaeus monodon]|uniref:cuticle protein AMP1A-like n=1 Tax=Penaeus monodon TaxID=6687 RepID=UPI0018A73F37|nr:cuticle protein AMP1A-like [Penaeus monodon]
MTRHGGGCRPGGLYKLEGHGTWHQCLATALNMKLLIVLCVVAAAVAAPSYGNDNSSEREAEILRDDRVHGDDGRYNVDVETENGITLSQSGSPEGNNGAISKAGQYTYTAPDGTVVSVKFVANANGYQPESDHLPVAPEFPHPIPDFVLRQIEFAAEEEARRARGEVSRSYGAPEDD